MSIISVLYYLLIRPLELIYEFIFSVSYKLTGSSVLSIVFLSITVGMLCLPLYTRADALQAESNEVENKLKTWKTKIKKSFRGDEQVMMLQAYYRENHYHPLMMLRSSISLLLQIPFFITAYRMLSSSVALSGATFGPIGDLGAPDGLIKIGSFAINLLPILMTAINILSGTIYTKGMGIKPKLQLYITALVFLVLLYGSPSGLVLYWTLNNVFSLLKNIVMKLIPVKRKNNVYIKDKNDTIVFFLYALCISFFIGFLIPSNLLKQSVGDLLTNFRNINLLHYIEVSLLISLGLFLVWGSIYFFVLENRRIVAGLMICLTGFALLNYFAFFRNNGDLDRYYHFLFYNNDSYSDCTYNLIILALSAVLIFIVVRNKIKIFVYLAFPALVTIIAVSIINTNLIVKEMNSYSFTENQRDYPTLTLSYDKPNVVVIMLDRAIGRISPYIFNEHPDILEQFDGFTWYSNSLSFGQHTNMAIPALYGGYEYTPAQMNARSEVSLEDKHNEAVCVMPVLFGENGYNVTVLDPSFAGYKYIPNLSIFDNYPYIDAYITEGILNPYYDIMTDDWENRFERNLFAYSLRYASPICLRRLLYDDGFFNDLNNRLTHGSFFQTINDLSHATGLNYGFLNYYYSLVNLTSITNITDSDAGSFVIMSNGITHEPTILEEPTYSISHVIDNSDYDNDASRFYFNGINLEILNPLEMGQYHSQTAAFELLGNWFDYLREQGVYDNTRIIIVSDHGGLYDLFGTTHDRNGNYISIDSFNCLFMVKDFGDTGFTVTDDFITNAETPIFAFDELIDNPVNPFTGNPIVSQLNDPNSFRYLVSGAHNVTDNNGNTFQPGEWFTYDPASGNIYTQSAWEYYGEG
ncbi:MAG: membrane protein insertase YidC [Clostridiales bacterium]|nr:membrane protein insertase YidC [Clostridiales bacterium]